MYRVYLYAWVYMRKKREKEWSGCLGEWLTVPGARASPSTAEQLWQEMLTSLRQDF